MGLNLDSEGEVCSQLARINNRVFWRTQMKIERHKEEEGAEGLERFSVDLSGL